MVKINFRYFFVNHVHEESSSAEAAFERVMKTVLKENALKKGGEK
jgi:hypothetical protein